jgi:hypothetical protein
MNTFATVLPIIIFLASPLPEGFLGTWKQVSIDGKPNTSATMTVREAEGVVEVETLSEGRGSKPVHHRFLLDGQEYTETLNRSTERVTKAKWEKDSLRISSTIRPIRSGPQDLTSPAASVKTYIDEKWMVSSDGKRLTVVSKMSGLIEGKTTTIYEKQ